MNAIPAVAMRFALNSAVNSPADLPTSSPTISLGALQAKAQKAGSQFEAILLNMVFANLQRTCAQLPGTTEEGITRSYDGLGIEALTSGLARTGGIGLGAFIARELIAHYRLKTDGI